MTEPADFNSLTALYRSAAMMRKCKKHEPVAALTGDGYYRIACPSCGLVGFTDYEGAKLFGFIKEDH